MMFAEMSWPDVGMALVGVAGAVTAWGLLLWFLMNTEPADRPHTRVPDAPLWTSTTETRRGPEGETDDEVVETRETRDDDGTDSAGG